MQVTFERTLPSRYELLSPLADEVGAFLEEHVADEDLGYRALLLATEAVTNAMEHGNGLDSKLSVYFRLDVSPDGVRITVEDQGPGFDPVEAPDAVTDDDPLSERHRGLFLMRSYAQEMRYENGGRRIVLNLARA